jgi:hypothetical protein
MSDLTPKMPEFKVSKNGYEIRTEVLQMAKDLVGQDFHYKYMGWEASVERDKDGKVVTRVGMPEFPGLEKILETAERMYGFINQTKHK